MNSIARSATVVALLGFQDRVLMHEGAAGIEDYSALSAVFWDLYPILQCNDVPLPRSATRALEHCRQVQADLIQLLASMGLLKQSGSSLLDRILQFGYRLTQKKALQRAGKNYRDSVFLLRDIVMDAVTHYHLQHMRHELDHLCGNPDKEKIEVTLPGKAPEILTKPKRAWTTGSINEIPRANIRCHEEWIKAKEEDLRFTAIAYIPTNHDDIDNGAIASSTDSTSTVIPLRGLYDTGSDRNLVSLSFLKKHALYDSALVRALPEPETVKGAEKSMETKIDHEADIKWCMDGSDPQTNTFSVMDTGGDSYDILLGWPFIINEGKVAVKKKKVPDRVRPFGVSWWTGVQMAGETERNWDEIARRERGEGNLPSGQPPKSMMSDDVHTNSSRTSPVGAESRSPGTTAIGSPSSVDCHGHYGTSPPSEFTTPNTTPGSSPPGPRIFNRPMFGTSKKRY